GMDKLLHRLTDYFVHRTGWIFGVALLLAAYALTRLADSESGAVFLRFVCSLAMISAPVLTFAHLRERLPVRMRSVARWLVFGLFCGGILLYGPTVQGLPFTKYQLAADSLANQQGVRVLFLVYLLLEALFWWSGRRSGAGESFRWLTRLRLPWLAAGIILLFSLGVLLSANDVEAAAAERAGSARWVWYLVVLAQVFAVYYAYYLLYYLHHQLLFRRLLQQRGVVFYLLGVVGLLLVFTPLHALFAQGFTAISAYRLHSVGITGTLMADAHFGLSSGVILLSLPYIIIVEWYRKERAINRLEAEKSATELQLLKEQINPHFFFNTLNNLYAMSLTREERTPETILQLSELMRYVIYRAKEESVPLREEIKYLRDYLDLQSIRLQKKLDLRFAVDVDDEGRRVPPLLFVILLENAFKHGIEPAEGDTYLHLSLTADAKRLTFTCRNSYEPRLRDRKDGGLGLRNLCRRLDLLYPNQYELTLRTFPRAYEAKLTLPATR
ncbi:MAG: sensor histidine kinase, partial [Bacteroidota bacterium]